MNLALIMGFSSYLLKLVETDVPELRRPLVLLWAKLLAVDAGRALAEDLVAKASAVRYFSRFITEPQQQQQQLLLQQQQQQLCRAAAAHE